jgi:alkylglycerol monooxygenase
MFGTFAPESDKVVYGLVHPINAWNPLWGQFHHAYYIITNITSKHGFLNMCSFLFKGPGWSPGKLRLGDIQDIPQVMPATTSQGLPTELHFYRYLLMRSHMILSYQIG